ncbi:unnamed protein product [marine sediment metagenome]|uniref:Uncharacterized protein n=1 Tax=marine sediment metagenome TaxID=412755 RepID=X1C605_9ZZZZ
MENKDEQPCAGCVFKELSCKPSISKELYEDVFALWDETYKRTAEDNEPQIALERFKNKYEVR